MLLAGPRAQAQTTQPTMSLTGNMAGDTEYKGPRFPGGPDSLRALLVRTLRRASPTLTGQLFLRLTLDEQGVVSRTSFLAPADRATIDLTRSPAARKLADELMNKLSVWQLPQPDGKPRPTTSSIILPLTFGPGAATMPLLYSDELPLFPASEVPGIAKGQAVPSLSYFLMYQVQYPAEDFRQQREGVVYAYFEVSETGAIEQRRIVGSVSPTLDAEVLRVLQNLPNAVTPPRQQGRPVRISWLLPANFKLK